MTKVTITKEQGLIKNIKFSGHAGYYNHGPDIVCAAISMAAQMTVIGLCSVAKTDITEKFFNPGEAEITLHDPSNIQAQTLVNTLELALLDLALQYPENLQVYSE